MTEIHILLADSPERVMETFYPPRQSRSIMIIWGKSNGFDLVGTLIRYTNVHCPKNAIRTHGHSTVDTLSKGRKLSWLTPSTIRLESYKIFGRIIRSKLLMKPGAVLYFWVVLEMQEWCNTKKLSSFHQKAGVCVKILFAE